MNNFTKARPTIAKRRAALDAMELTAALIILEPENIAKYGAHSGMVRTAKLTVARLRDHGQLPLELPPEAEAA